MNVNKRKVILILLIIWLCFALVLTILNYALLSQPILNSRFAFARLIPPSKSAAEKITAGMTMDEVFSIVGYPDGPNTFTGMNYMYWELQGGNVLWVAEYNGYASQPQIIDTHFSSRWLLFPGMLFLIAAVEVVTYCVIHKKVQVN